VGLGPGGLLHRTPAAEQAVRQAEVVVGFTGYVEQCRDLLVPAQRVLAFPLGSELARARVALEEAAAGRRVALVCSGDPGVYAMASPLLELVGETGADGTASFAAVDVHVVPGVTASLAASAVLGAPLGHDHAVVSLSDLHTPWEAIATRVLAAAEADLVLVLYNPRSRRRTWQIEEARAILLRHRAPDTPVGLVTDAARHGQRALMTTLADMPAEEVSMTTCVIVGATTTRLVNGRMVTPRGYDR
jgi:cobalt-precorrin 5A hydrolase/precorrin-3B C17-methyltransferase